MSDVADIGSDTTPQFVTESGELQKRAKKKKTNTRKEGNPTERWKQDVGKKGKKGCSSHSRGSTVAQNRIGVEKHCL